MSKFFRPFAVVAPAPPSAGRRNVADTELRLARNVAGLFGVPVPDGRTGMRWVCDYNLLTIGEIGRGAPSPARNDNYDIREHGWFAVGRAVVEGPSKASGSDKVTARRLPGGLDEIARATLQRYGPDTKAALVLVAADDLFSALLPVMGDVIDVLGTSEDGLPIADATRIAIWAAMVADVLRDQPALFNAAVRARAIQQAAVTPWEPDFTRVGTPARSEIREDSPSPSPSPSSAALETVASKVPRDLSTPYTLCILDEFLLQRVKPKLTRNKAAHEVDASNVFLGLDLISRWMRHILHSSDRALTWIRSDGDCWWSEAYLPEIAPLATFVDDIQRQNPEVVPVAEQPDSDRHPAIFDRSDSAHRRRLRPRVPSLPEVARLVEPSRRAVLNTHMTILRVLRDCPAYKCSAVDRETERDAREIVELAVRIFGEGDPLTMKLTATHLRFSSRNRFDTTDDPIEYGNLHAEAIQRLHVAWLSGAVPDDWWVETVYSNSATLNTHIQDLRAADRSHEADELFRTLVGYWREALNITGFQPPRDGAEFALPPVRAQEMSNILPGLLHNFVGLMAKSTMPEDRLWAIDTGLNVLLPLRIEVGEQRNADSAVRTTVQVILRSIDATIDSVGPDVQDQLVQAAEEGLRILASTDMYDALIERDMEADSQSDLIFLEVLAATLIMLSERSERLPERLTLAREILSRVHAGRIRRSGELGSSSGQLESSDELDRLNERLERLEDAPR